MTFREVTALLAWVSAYGLIVVYLFRALSGQVRGIRLAGGALTYAGFLAWSVGLTLSARSLEASGNGLGLVLISLLILGVLAGLVVITALLSRLNSKLSG